MSEPTGTPGELQEHDVREDYAGWRNWPRLTCFTCEETLLRKPYQGDIEWRSLVRDFRERHRVGSKP